jgi:DNA-3-methyladenine glycosylase II
LGASAETTRRVVHLKPPLDIAGSLELFRRSGDDLIDRWDGTRLIRAAPIDRNGWAPFIAVASGSVDAPSFEVSAFDSRHEQVVEETVATTFTPVPAGYADLLASDPALAYLDRRFPGIRQIRQLDLFTALVRCISAQQVNLRWAVTTRRRLAEAFGVRHTVAGETVYGLDPHRIAKVDPAAIRALQFTTSKAVSIVAVAQTLVAENLSAVTLATLTDDEIIRVLARIKGIGVWSAEWVLARTLGRARVVAGDLGVRKAIGIVYLDDPKASETAIRSAAEHWGDSAGIAQALLLHALGEGALSPAALPELRAASRR